MVVYTLEQRWEILREIDLQRCRFWQKKIIVSDEAHLGAQLGHAYIEKPTHPKLVTVWCGFWSRDIIGPFFFENE